MSNPAAQPDADLTQARAEYERFIDTFQSLILATVNEDGSPLASYTPFAVDEQKQFYIFISDLAGHTANIRRSGQVSLMLIEDEQTAGQIFARKRLTFQGRATPLARDSAGWQQAAGLYRAKFGQFFQMIESFSDFRMFKLSPSAGRFVLGFGQAYEVGGKKLDFLTHRK